MAALGAVLEALGADAAPAVPVGAGLQRGIEHAAGVIGSILDRVALLLVQVAELRGRQRRRALPAKAGTP